MPKYLVLSQYTAEGRTALRADSYVSRLDAGRRAAASLGGTVDNLFYVRPGVWDQLVIGEMSEEATFRLAAEALSSAAYRAIEFHRLYDGAEADALLASGLDWSAPGGS